MEAGRDDETIPQRPRFGFRCRRGAGADQPAAGAVDVQPLDPAEAAEGRERDAAGPRARLQPERRQRDVGRGLAARGALGDLARQLRRWDQLRRRRHLRALADRCARAPGRWYVPEQEGDLHEGRAVGIVWRRPVLVDRVRSLRQGVPLRNDERLGPVQWVKPREVDADQGRRPLRKLLRSFIRARLRRELPILDHVHQGTGAQHLPSSDLSLSSARGP